MEKQKNKINLLQNASKKASDFFECRESATTYDYPTHQHNYLETEIILDGEVTHICNGIATPIKRGSVYIIRTTDHHAYKCVSSATISSVAFGEKLLSADTLLRLNTFRGNIISHMDEKTFENFLKLYRLAKNEFLRKNKNERIVKNLVNCICIYVLRHCNETDNINENSIASTVLVHLHNNFRRNITLNGLAAELGYTPNHISRIFKKEIGTSFNQYLNDLRIKYAEHLLSTADLSITDIAIQSGFRSYDHFQKNFLKSIGLTPSEYRDGMSTNIYNFDYNINVSPYYSFINGNSNVYAMILISPLKANTLYAISYSSNNDTNLIPEYVQSPTGELIDIVIGNHKNKFKFKTLQAGEYIVRLLKTDSKTGENVRLTVPHSVAIKEIDSELQV